LEPLLADDDVWEVMVNAPDATFAESSDRIAACGGTERSGCARERVTAGCAPLDEIAGGGSAASMFGGEPGLRFGAPAPVLPAGEFAVHFLDVD
jgi:hypothetical protein